MTNESDIERRIQRRISRASVKHMSNAKWRKLFSALHSLPQPCGLIGIKLIGAKRVFSVSAPGPNFEYDDNFGECGGISFVPFSHIEYVGVSNSGLIEHLKVFGKWPIQIGDEGILILGYKWLLDMKYISAKP